MKSMSYKIESIKNERNRHGTQETVKKGKSRHRTQERVPKVGRKDKIQTAAGLNNESKVSESGWGRLLWILFGINKGLFVMRVLTERQNVF